MPQRTPLALAILLHNKKRLAVAIVSIAFASILMFQQQGYKHALYDSSSEIVRQLDADWILFSNARFAVSAEQRFAKTSLDRIAGIAGVESAIPIYLENTAARLRRIPPNEQRFGQPEKDSDRSTVKQTAASSSQNSGNSSSSSGFKVPIVGVDYWLQQRARPIRVIGIPLDRSPFELKMDQETVERLAAPRTALIDRLSKPQYGFDLHESVPFEQAAELSDQRLNLVGYFTLGQDFVHDGNLLMSQENLAKYFPYRGTRPLSVVDLGVVKATTDAEKGEVFKRIRENLPAGVSVLSRQEFVQRESKFWAKSTPIGVIFNVGAIMGFVVGVIICYQILVDDISHQIGEYATLKAMGYTNGFLCRVVMQQAGLLAIGSFLPSLLITYGAFQLTYAWTGLKMELTLWRVVFVLSLTFCMCLFSSLLAIRRLIAADPASLFR